MKRTLLLILSILSFAALSAQEQKEVVTGADYVNDIYYSLENGIVGTEARNNWDIGFTTYNFSISVLANTATGVEVYTWPLGDTADWENLTAFDAEWEQMYNSTETWETGAFETNATGEMVGMTIDVGWGSYNMGNHVITGDSLFVVKTVGGVYKKLVIVQRSAMANTWEFKFANLDGTEEEIVSFNANDYSAKNFIYYSLDNAEIVDREPPTADWDMIFTKYTEVLDNEGTPWPQNVTGILANEDHIQALEVRESGMVQASYGTFEYTEFDNDTTWFINNIGYDWKKLNLSEMVYNIIDTVVYFVKDTIGDDTHYKIYFTDFTGGSEGKYTFMQEMVFPLSARDYEMLPVLELYPNPASDHLNVVFDHQGEVSLQIIDMTGRTVYRTTHNGGGLTDLQMDIAELNPGLFFLKMDAGGSSNVLRFIKQ